MPLMRRGVGRVGRPGLVGTMARTVVVAGTATVVVGGVSRHQQNKQEEQQQAVAYQAEQAAPPPQEYVSPPPPPPAAAPSEDSALDQLKQLGELHQSGVLTDEEFVAQKAKILGS